MNSMNLYKLKIITIKTNYYKSGYLYNVDFTMNPILNEYFYVTRG